MCNRRAYFGNTLHRQDKFAEHLFRNFSHKHHQSTNEQTPANVEEFDDKYLLHISAPGFDKKDFVVHIKDDALVIKAKPTIEEGDEFRWRRREFNADSIERRFKLNEKIDRDKISATYQDGVLQITLPKLEGFESVRYQVDVD